MAVALNQQPVPFQSCSFLREDFHVQTVRQVFQAQLHPVDPPADPLGHPALPVPVLRQEVPPEVRHEEAHLHPHR